jgi:hypothetical protein
LRALAALSVLFVVGFAQGAEPTKEDVANIQQELALVRAEIKRYTDRASWAEMMFEESQREIPRLRDRERAAMRALDDLNKQAKGK